MSCLFSRMQLLERELLLLERVTARAADECRGCGMKAWQCHKVKELASATPPAFTMRDVAAHTHYNWVSGASSNAPTSWSSEDDHALALRARTGVGPRTVREPTWLGGHDLRCDYQNVLLPFAEGWDVRRTFDLLRENVRRKNAAYYSFQDWDDEQDDTDDTETSIAIAQAPVVRFGLSVAKVRVVRKRRCLICHRGPPSCALTLSEHERFSKKMSVTSVHRLVLSLRCARAARCG